jgi:hypothetical protein
MARFMGRTMDLGKAIGGFPLAGRP